MKLSLKLLFLVSAIVATSQTSYVAADGGDALSASDAVPVESDAAVAVEESASVDDAGKECAAGDCEGGAKQVEEEDEPETAEEPVVEEAKVPEDPKCPSRPHIIRCSAMYLDTNKNNALDREELKTAMGQVPWLLRRKLFQCLSGGANVINFSRADLIFYLFALSRPGDNVGFGRYYHEKMRCRWRWKNKY